MTEAGLKQRIYPTLKVNYTFTKDECASGGHCLSLLKRLPPVFVLSARQSLPHTNIFNMQNLVIVVQMIFTFMVLRFGRFSKTTLSPFQRTMTKIRKIFNIQNVSVKEYRLHPTEPIGISGFYAPSYKL